MAESLNYLSLCSGVGMLDVGLRAALDHLGINSRCLGLCERDAYAAAVLMERMADESLESAPVFCGDMRDLDARPMRGIVDLVCAGLPCQPYSVAGKQAGLADKRSWGSDDSPLPQFLRIVAECRPSLVFLENVPAWVCGGWFRPFGEELCRLDFTIEEPLFVTAESVGASHRRERVFVLAHALRILGGERTGWQRVFDGGEKLAQSASGGFGELRQSPGSDGLVDGCDQAMDDAGCDGSSESGETQTEERARRRRGKQSGGRRGNVGDAERPRPQRDGSSIPQRRSLPLPPNTDRRIFAPGPSDPSWRDTPQALWPAVEPGFRLHLDGSVLVVDESRTDQLRCAGNGCVPLQAAVAFIELVRRLV